VARDQRKQLRNDCVRNIPAWLADRIETSCGVASSERLDRRAFSLSEAPAMAESYESDSAIIYGAYAERVHDAFKVLAENLSTGQNEKACAERFMRALRIVQRARDLALESVSGVVFVEPETVAPEMPRSEAVTAVNEVLADPLSMEDQEMIDKALAGTTNIHNPNTPKQQVPYSRMNQRR
jgi:hypothetical protein